MPDKADIAGVVLAGMGIMAGALFIVFVPDAFNSNVPGSVLFFVLTVPIYSYAAYWAFSIRHALTVRLYRNQAFGIGFIVLALWSTLAVFVLGQSSASLLLIVGVGTLSFYFLFIVLFYWIDASVLASRRSDPLLRDTLYWSKLRIPLWIANIISWVIPLSLISYAGVTGDVALLNQLNTGTFSNSIIGQAVGIIYNFPIVILICGIVFLPAIAIRSKWDKTLRRHFAWFAPASAGLVLIFFGGIPYADSLVGHIISVLVVVAMGYTLYKSAKSLVPLNRISLVEAAK